MRTICLTGAQEFLGRHLSDGFASQGMRVFEFSSKRPEDLGESDAVVHLAARMNPMKGNEAEEACLRDNTELTLTLAKRALETGVRLFVVISTTKVMGDTLNSDKIYEETDQPTPTDAYSKSGLMAETQLSELFQAQTEARCVILRLPMVYGPHNKGHMLKLLKAAQKKIPLPIGKANSQRSMVFVKNVVDAVQTILNDTSNSRPQVETFFITDDQDLSSSELYSQLYFNFNGTKGVFGVPESCFRFLGTLGSRLEELTGKIMPVNEMVVSRLFDSARFKAAAFKRAYDWKPPFSPAEALKETVEWFQSLQN